MLICIENYKVELRTPNAKNSGSDFHQLKNLEVVLVVDELRVISFDRFGLNLPSSVAFDDQVRAHLSFLRHFLMKQVLIPQEFEMVSISSIPLRRGNVANEERSSFFPPGAINGKTPSMFSGGKSSFGVPAQKNQPAKWN